MIKKGMLVQAIESHYDEHFGDIFIIRGDRFEVLDHCISSVRLRPLDQRQYPGEHEIHSRERMFHAYQD